MSKNCQTFVCRSWGPASSFNRALIAGDISDLLESAGMKNLEAAPSVVDECILPELFLALQGQYMNYKIGHHEKKFPKKTV